MTLFARTQQKIVTFQCLVFKNSMISSLMALARSLLYIKSESQNQQGENRMKFEVGKKYKNRVGEFYVVDIEGDEMKVVYDNHNYEEILSQNIQERIVENVVHEDLCKLPRVRQNRIRRKGTGYRKFKFKVSSEFYKMFGYFASHGKVYAMVKPENDDTFRLQYKSFTGVDAEGYTILDNPQWWNEMRLTVGVPDDGFELTTFGNVPVYIDKERSSAAHFCSTSMVWWLFENGFKIGRLHDIEAARECVPEEYRNNFDEGYNVIARGN